jgi:hypothetical protein
MQWVTSGVGNAMNHRAYRLAYNAGVSIGRSHALAGEAITSESFDW